MPHELTAITELATALGMLGYRTVVGAIADRPAQLKIADTDWDRLASWVDDPANDASFRSAFANGRAFLHAADGLRDRPPRIIEWTGAARSPGDEIAPIDLRVDHVYLVSCKYLSRVLSNPSPGRLFDGLLTTSRRWDTANWYEVIAPDEYQQFYESYRGELGLAADVPELVGELTGAHRLVLKGALGRGAPFPPAVRPSYAQFCRAVSQRSAERWQTNIARDGESMLWRLLRIGSAPYFILGEHAGGPLRLRVAGPWDWRQRFRFGSMSITPGTAGQPQVEWRASYRRLGNETDVVVAGHIEIRWSHGRFGGKPEAKVYVETPLNELPGYFPLDDQTTGAWAGDQQLPW